MGGSVVRREPANITPLRNDLDSWRIFEHVGWTEYFQKLGEYSEAISREFTSTFDGQQTTVQGITFPLTEELRRRKRKIILVREEEEEEETSPKIEEDATNKANPKRETTSNTAISEKSKSPASNKRRTPRKKTPPILTLAHEEGNHQKIELEEEKVSNPLVLESEEIIPSPLVVMTEDGPTEETRITITTVSKGKQKTQSKRKKPALRRSHRSNKKKFTKTKSPSHIDTSEFESNGKKKCRSYITEDGFEVVIWPTTSDDSEGGPHAPEGEEQSPRNQEPQKGGEGTQDAPEMEE
ncbi:hypothetical protein KI387_031847 [Taxus chinensis]|uniref:Uncharacterized protein n=1 Tax=Taxus chinensis TaxID=29808 RepID=A0AA38BMZ1_TAXCH|nr:hypothetical protein KI387_031847 [Taxus chinensis]